MPELVGELWYGFLALGGLATLAAAIGAGTHAAMWKRDARSATAWIAFILLLPLVGAIAYWLFGINRIQRKAGKLFRDHNPATSAAVPFRCDESVFESETLCELAGFVNRVVEAPIQAGNHLEIYQGGDAFRAMLAGIAGARRSVTLLTYIFDHDPTGLSFLEALKAAKARGVLVRVLIDAVGDRYTRPLMCDQLRGAGVEAAVFNPTFLPRSATYSNLRNHRKLMVVDGRLAFTGGMNLRHGHDPKDRSGKTPGKGGSGAPVRPIQDVHFRVEGPVVSSLQEIFVEDWRFTTDEKLEGEAFFPELEPAPSAELGESLHTRVIADGPAENLNHLRWTLLGGLACARERVRIQTPYFLPDPGLITALIMAARRGVEVEIYLPERGNLKLVQWASTSMWWQVLEGGCRIYLTPPPFDHSKLMVLDGIWSLIGSANWDPRSLRLNFELNLEVYSPAFTARIEALLDKNKAKAREITLAEVDARRWWIRLRDGLARLASPYL